MDLVVVLWQHSLEESVKNVNSNTNAVVEIIATIIVPAHRLHKTTVLLFLMTGKRQYSGPWFGRSFCKPRLLLADIDAWTLSRDFKDRFLLNKE